MSEQKPKPALDIMVISGRRYLTFAGFNTLREYVGMEPLKMMPRESFDAFRDRNMAARREFFEAYPHLVEDFEAE